jgi:hypothetical protein
VGGIQLDREQFPVASLFYFGTKVLLTTNRIAKKRLQRGIGLETIVDATAIVGLVLSCIIACPFFFTFSLWGFLIAISIPTGAFFQWLLLRCIAEHLRLQKKLAGYPFQGEISGPKDFTVWACGNCGQFLHSESMCEACGAKILETDAPMGSSHRT